MTATEYLHWLQEKARRTLPAVTIDPVLREQRLNLYGSIPRFKEVYDGEHTAETRDKDFKHNFVVPLLDQLPKEISTPFRKVCIGFLPSTELNVWAMRVPDGDPIIVVNSKTINALGYFVQLIQATAGLHDEGRLQEASELFGTGISQICASVAESKEGTFPVLPDISWEALGYAVNLVVANVWFILAHEFAHIHLGHLLSLSEVSLSLLHPSLRVQKYNRSQIEEFEADACAFGWMMNAGEHGVDHIAKFIRENPVACLEVLTLFHYIELGLEAKTSEESSHPSPRDRVQHLNSLFGSSMPHDARSRLEQWSEWMGGRKDG